jgi:ABC-type molybdate transport system permease subunit
MVAGSIAGKTQTLSIAVYEAVRPGRTTPRTSSSQ